MNFVKRLSNRKVIYLIFGVIIIIIAATFVLLQVRNSKKVVFLTIQNDYSYIKDQKNGLSVQVNCSRDDTMYFNKKLIRQCSFMDYESYDSVQVNLQSIKKKAEKIKYDGEEYFGYQLSFDLPFSSNDIMKFNNFYLKMEYVNDEIISLPLGSVAIASSDYLGDDLVIGSLQGIVNDSNNYQTLVGIVIKPLSEADDVEIVDIKAVSSVVSLNLGDSVELIDEVVNNDSLEKLLNKEYDLYNSKLDSQLREPLEMGKQYLIPFHYNKCQQIKTLAFTIKYLKNNELFEQLIYPFQFFNGPSQAVAKKVTL